MRKVLFEELGLEAIDFQSGALFEELTAAIKKVRGAKVITQKDLDSVDIPAIVRSHTGMGITVEIRVDSTYNACIIPPQVDRNHPFYDEYVRPHAGAEGVTAIRALGGKALAGIDRKRSRVTGIYTQFLAKVYFTSGILNSPMFSDAELAAILLHELGHNFTYFEFLGNTFTANYVLSATTAAILKTDSLKERDVLLMEAEKQLGVKLSDRTQVANTKTAAMNDTVAMVFLSELANKSRSELGTNLYDIRSWEQLSDQFATRHGAGKDLVTGLDKIYRAYGSPSTLSNAGFLSMEAIKFVMWSGSILVPVAVGAAPLAFFGIAFAFLACVVLNPQAKVYDDPEARVKLVRKQLTEALKQKDISEAERKALLKDIELVQTVEDGLTDRRGLVEFMWAKVFPWGKKSASQAEMMKQLEELANNDLFVVANKFKLGASNA